MVSKVLKDLCTVAITPRYSVGINLGYCSLTATRITSKTTSNTLRPRGCRHHPSKFQTMIAKWGPVRHAKKVQT